VANRNQRSFGFGNHAPNRAGERDQVWSGLVVQEPEKFGGINGIMFEIALKHLHRIGKPHPSEHCLLCRVEQGVVPPTHFNRIRANRRKKLCE
jgi:hypothetical protein